MRLRILSYVLIIGLCLAAYFISKNFISNILVEKEITYTRATASQVDMAWGNMDTQQIDKRFWPAGSYKNEGVIYSRMSPASGKFTITLKLPAGTNIYYWMVQRKDLGGNEVDIWDSGGTDTEYFNESFVYNGFFKPGYFIFLAGFIPLLIHFLKNRKSEALISETKIFAIKDYVPQFDSIRAVAVILVVIHHWIPKTSPLNFLPNGSLGVNIFFVLSGFLITGILLKSKQQVEAKRLSTSTVFKNFYIRRTLRIFPIYYLYLVIFWFLNDQSIREHAVYYFTYTSNILFYSKQFFSGHFAHLWSLAVEEQFYIFWPCLIILLNKKHLAYLFFFFIVFGISSNYIYINKGWWVQIFTPACFDAFAIGGFLSYLSIYRQNVIQSVQPHYKCIFLTVLTVFVLDVFNYSFLPERTVQALLAAVIIYYCLFKKNNKVINFVLSNKKLMWLGKISYGIYLYHLVIPEFWFRITQQLASWNIDLFYYKATPNNLKPLSLFIQEFSFLILMCSVSWHLIEKPINSLKKKFENKPPSKDTLSLKEAVVGGI